MAKHYNHLKDMLENQKKKPKVRKNSECFKCMSVDNLKLKEVDNELIVICKECYLKDRQ